MDGTKVPWQIVVVSATVRSTHDTGENSGSRKARGGISRCSQKSDIHCSLSTATGEASKTLSKEKLEILWIWMGDGEVSSAGGVAARYTPAEIEFGAF